MPSKSPPTLASAYLAHRLAAAAQLHRLEQALLRHAEAILCRASGIGLMIGLFIQPGRFPAPARTVGRAYMFRFWRPATFGELLDIVVAILIWPFGMVFCAVWFTWKNGAVIADQFGRSRMGQVADQLRLAATSGLPPPWYYVFELYRAGETRRAPAYLTRAETKQGSNRLLARARDSSSPLVDKEAFARFCNERQLKTLPVLFSVDQGQLHSTSNLRSLPQTDLFLKPACGCGGRGAERWDYAGNGRYRDIDDRKLSASELLDRLRRMSGRQPYLVQERARNHPSMSCLSNGTLNTIRMISCLDEREQPELIGAVLRMAIGTNVTVDNVHAGGIAAAIDLDEGRLDQATHMGMDVHRGWIDRHPDTGALIAGRLLPMWNEVRELTLRAHSAFNDWVVVGWDVAIMKDGPCLVEGNNGPDVDLIQRPLRTAFGESRLGQLIAFHLDQTERVWRA
jgi:Sugar-transfer associated ATP-grasp